MRCLSFIVFRFLGLEWFMYITWLEFEAKFGKTNETEGAVDNTGLLRGKGDKIAQ